MIVGNLKPIEEIIENISGFEHILILGCGSCVTVCLSGGDREAKRLAKRLSHIRYFNQSPPRFDVKTIQRQCEKDLIETYLEIPPGTEAILSLACGAGVQTVADAFDAMPVIPALNTTFLGAVDAPGIWVEKCKGCGDCILTRTGGICPVSRCAKRLFNGPCGGSRNGHCEVDADIPCAWALIYHRLKKQNNLHFLTDICPPRDWRTGGSGAPRTRKRTGIGHSPEDFSP
ncbi:MAG: methylenetetrahydrofolate reductase C-terminal domain-containing protein [Deltaproteobacteria bacterium]|nr:methylenetetrahydrofolate reductase C-terminal domain-containing protein [Deltaproteobacteria bacterium]MBW1960694.1 methylenetetrahydrofolate reductase C-terminal domain-containing protein [Deltaproteobacteria bacterium]MBW1996193.1 methylenetetrahydrofolate reductase C-terminal domain-containing protein [Deltaproteobacteria bacterium]MBW2151959.1 methylenetetrahydrofolate reductase C-terminal domain-containing protein [Deltaproteobacteria bacterium]